MHAHTRANTHAHTRTARVDSPNSLVTRGKRDAARRALQRLRGVEDVSAELEDLERAAAASGACARSGRVGARGRARGEGAGGGRGTAEARRPARGSCCLGSGTFNRALVVFGWWERARLPRVRHPAEGVSAELEDLERAAAASGARARSGRAGLAVAAQGARGRARGEGVEARPRRGGLPAGAAASGVGL